MRRGTLSAASLLPSPANGAGFLDSPYVVGADSRVPPVDWWSQIGSKPQPPETPPGQPGELDWLGRGTERDPVWQHLAGDKTWWDAGIAAVRAGTNPQAVPAWPEIRAFLGRAAQGQHNKVAAKYGRTASGAVDYTHLADGSPSGLDAQGRAPYTNEGALNPDYTGPGVPGQVGVPDVAHAPEWSAMYEAQVEQPESLQLEDGSTIPNPAYQGRFGWHLGDTPPPSTVPLTPEEASQFGAAIQTLDGYIANLEGALRKSKDPKKTAAIQSKLDTYRKRRDDYAGQVANGNPSPEWTRAPVNDMGAVPLVDETGALRLNPDGTVVMGNPSGSFGFDATPGWGTSIAPAVSTATPAAPAASRVPTDAVMKAQRYLERSVAARAKARTDAERRRLDEQILTWSRHISEYLAR